MKERKNAHAKPVSTSWGEVADWYDDTVETKGSYQQDLILPNLLRLMEIQKGEKILDLACGQGFFARAFHAAGAKVTAADISKELVDIARAKSPQDIDYHITPADTLPFLKHSSIRKLAIVLALQNIENMDATLLECARVLAPKGRLYLVLNHPAFRIPKESSWGFDEEKVIQYRRVDRYLSNLKIAIEMHPGSESSEQTVSFHRPLQAYVKSLSKQRLVIRRLEEWSSTKKSQPGPRSAAEDRARSEIPLFLAIEAEKVA